MPGITSLDLCFPRFIITKDPERPTRSIKLFLAIMSTSSQQPRDGPATAFQVDDRVAPLVEEGHAPTFGLVLVAGWPLPIETAYETLRTQTEDCFDKKDHPRIYLYPNHALHVTVATLHSLHQQPPGATVPSEKQEALITSFTASLEAAQKLPEWPSRPLQLQLQRAQIGERAGILVWKETTGGIERMRDCIRQTCGSAATTLAIPSIVHTTFLRYYQQLETPAEKVQQRFCNIPVRELFPDPVTMSDVHFVCERRPYMHHPDVLQTYSL